MTLSLSLFQPFYILALVQSAAAAAAFIMVKEVMNTLGKKYIQTSCVFRSRYKTLTAMVMMMAL